MATPKKLTAKADKKNIARKNSSVSIRTAGAEKPQPAGIPNLPSLADSSYRVRVRMYRQGLGDCFLLTFPRKGRTPFNLLIDCGALNRDKDFMTRVVEHIEESVKVSSKGRLDLVVATHEHKDHLSGFNQARDVFNRMDIGGVWLGWTENLSEADARAIKTAKKTAIAGLQAALSSSFAGKQPIEGIRSLLEFSGADDTTDAGLVADALEYLKLRGNDAGTLKFLEPGDGPLALDGVDDLRIYVLGPPRDPVLLKTSAVTKQMKGDSIVYHLTSTGVEGMNALTAALSSANNLPSSTTDDWCHPFSPEHRISRKSKWFQDIKPYVRATYDAPGHEWRRIDEDWLGAFEQLALNLDSDTNNTSLVLAFEFGKTGEVLLFVGDAQVGNWQSWANVSFKVPDSEKVMPAHDLLKRTVFYKVGHHCSHNATIKNGGLELMQSDKLVAFIPLDKETAKKQGPKDAKGKPKGWDMPAKPLYKRLLQKAAERVVISDRKEQVPAAALNAGITFDQEMNFVDYVLR